MAAHRASRATTATAPVLAGHRVTVLAHDHTHNPLVLPVHLGWRS